MVSFEREDFARTQCASSHAWRIKLFLFLALVGGVIFSGNYVLAQIVPDNTLGAESSQVTSKGSGIMQIDVGAIRGRNLFHSFSQFSVPTGSTAYFNNDLSIKNIISRVTGGSISTINGLLQARGTANLFLIAPNGITFGKNASLKIGGSFLATTANAIQFSDQGFFSASFPNQLGLLTVNPSALLFNQIAAASITNQSTAPVGIDPITGQSALGLSVPDGQSLLLVGGNLNLNGGRLNAFSGHIEVGGVTQMGTIGLEGSDSYLHLSYPNNTALSDIFLTDRARVDVDGEGSGTVEVQGRHVRLSGGSVILDETRGQNGKDLTVTSSESIELSDPKTSLTISTRGPGAAGNLTINTGNLIVRNGAQIRDSTTDKGSAGQLTVNASKSVELLGTAGPKGALSLLTSLTAGNGDAGNITISTGKLLVENGAEVSTESTLPTATGRGGALTVNASDSIELVGTGANTNRSSLSAITQGAGKAGDVTITTGKLLVQDGAQVTVSSKGTGPTGNLQVRAPSIQLDDQGSLNATVATGARGNITLNTKDLRLRHNSSITTDASSNANGGNINIDTNTSAVLEDSNITATAVRGQGGNIQITTQGLFRSLDSSISASSKLGISGRVQINTPVNNPSQGLVNLPVKPVDVIGLIAQGCPGDVGPGASKFVVNGHGGLPPTPREALASEPPLADLGTTVSGQENRASAATAATNLSNSESAPIVEATGWVTNTKGVVMLVANPPTFTSDIPWMAPTSCHAQ